MHRPRFHLHAAAVMLLLTSLGTAGQTPTPAATPTAAEASGSGVITGRVVNESGQGLPNAYVYVQAAGSAGPGRTTSTDRDGNFKVSGLERVPYQVSAQMATYVSAPRDPDSPQPNQYNVGDSVTIVLTKGGVITGTVTNAAGEPIIAIGVRVQMISANGRRVLVASGGRETSTDDRGVYRVYGLRAGTYIVMAGGANDYSHTGINAFALDVPTYAPSSNRETAAEISVRNGEEATNIDIRYRGERGRIVSGTVSGPDSENASVNVTLTALSENGPQRETSMFQPRTAEFTFTGLSDGNYLVTARARTQAGEVTVSESKAITVSSADVSGIELVPRPMASVAGRVLLEETKAAECSEKTRPAFKDMWISAWHNDNQAAKNQPQFLWSMGVPVHPDEQGNVLIKNLNAGQYYFAARSATSSWYLQSVSLAPATQSAKPGKAIDATKVWTTVRLGERLSGLTITLAQGGASLHGRLVLAEGETRPEQLLMYLVPAEPERATDIFRYYAILLPADGKLVLNSLAPERYWVLAKAGPEGPTASLLSKVRFPDETETRARLRREAEAGKTEVEFKPCQNVVGFELPFKAVAP
jgi:hypothetical protein